jgi:hypothetical protein
MHTTSLVIYVCYSNASLNTVVSFVVSTHKLDMLSLVSRELIHIISQMIHYKRLLRPDQWHVAVNMELHLNIYLHQYLDYQYSYTNLHTVLSVEFTSDMHHTQMELNNIDHITTCGKSNVRTYIQEKMIILLESGNNSIRHVVSSSDISS